MEVFQIVAEVWRAKIERSREVGVLLSSLMMRTGLQIAYNIFN